MHFSDNVGEEGWVISSESCGFLSIGARYVREVYPGEIVEITRTGIRTISTVHRPENKPPAFCIFEYVYFARADSIFEGKCFHHPLFSPVLLFPAFNKIGVNDKNENASNTLRKSSVEALNRLNYLQSSRFGFDKLPHQKIFFIPTSKEKSF